MDRIIIKFEIKQTGETRIAVDGDTHELFASILTLIKSLYHNMMLNTNELAARAFVADIADVLINPINPLNKEFYAEGRE